MEVLYEYTAGSAPFLPFAIFFWALGIILVILCIIMMIQDGEIHPIGVLCLGASVFIDLFGFFFNKDTRHQEIKATIDETVSWKEVNEKYELVKQEGEIYTFRVRDNAGEE